MRRVKIETVEPTTRPNLYYRIRLRLKLLGPCLIVVGLGIGFCLILFWRLNLFIFFPDVPIPL